MSPVTNHTIALSINSTDRTGLLLKDSIFVRSSIGNATNMAEFDLRDPSGAFAPADWDEVVITVDSTAIFGGFIVQREQDSIGAGSAKSAVWHVVCKDWSVLFDRVLVDKQYTETSDAIIVPNLLATYLSGEGFNGIGHVTLLREDVDINFEEITLREAYNELAQRCGANWHVDADKCIWWYAPSSPASASFGISDTPDGSTTFAPLEQTLKRSVDSNQIVNRVRAIGGDDSSTTLQTDTFAANGTDFVFGPLTRKPHSMWQVTYTITSGGVDTTVTAWASQIGLEPQDAFLVDGGEETVLVHMDNRTVKIKDVGGLVPKAGTNVTVKYYYSTPVEVTVDDAASQAAFGRVFETSIYDDGLTSADEATEYAEGLLAEYAFGRETIQFQITRHGLQPGQAVTVYSSTLGIDDTYLIQETQWSAVAVDQDEFMAVCQVQAGAMIHTILDTLRPSYSAGAGRISKTRPGRLSQLATDLGDIVAGRATFTDGGTAKFEWGEPNGASGVVIGLEPVDDQVYGANYIYDGGTIKAKLGRLTGLPDIAGVTPTGWGIYTNNGFFSGKLVASEMVGGTLTASTFNGGNINEGTIAASLIQGGTVTAPYIDGGTISGIALVGQTIEGAQIIGGTITSVLLESSWIANGTIDSMAGSIGGFTIEDNLLWSNGGTIATGSVVNSSNPGAYLTDDGLFGFGTLGMTFGLWTDPAKAPWFSSGTINNAVYEVYESGIIRTGSAVFQDGGVQIDNSGIFGVNPITGAASLLLENGDRLLLENGEGIELYGLKFALDSVTGKLSAEDAYIQGEIHARTGKFSGTVESSYINGGTITGAKLVGVQVVGQTISGSDIIGGTITGVPIADAGITNGSLDSSLILGGTMTAAQIVGGTITGGVFTGGNVSQGTIAAARINGGTVSGALISGGTFSGGTTSGGTISAARMIGGTVSGGLVSGGTINSAYITGETGGASTFYLDTTGLHLNAAADARNIRWEQGGTIIASIFTQYSGGVVTTTETTGLGSTSLSHAKRTRVRFNDTTYSELYQTPASWSFRRGVDPSWNTKFQIADTENVSYVKFRPGVSATNTELGDSTHAWRYLYLYDGTDEWRISISSTGQLLTTKV